MAAIGYFLSSEERGPKELIDGALAAEQAGFRTLWISDHYHPWTDEQGESPFVWTTLGAIAAMTDLEIYTAVTCPIMRMHPAVVAQAAATVAALAEQKSGRPRFGLGVGTGEALNEHILGDAWPSTNVRLDMLEECVEVMRRLWTGEIVDHRGVHYEVDHAQLYTRPDAPPPVYVSAFGPKAASLAARIADGFTSVGPQGELLAQYRAEGGRGGSQTGMKVAWAASEEEGIRNAHRIWPNEGLPGELAQVLPTPQHFMQASQLVTPEMIAKSTPCGPDPDKHIAAIREHVDAGFDEVYVGHIGPDQQGMLDFYAKEVLPHVG